jgi:hypothetical protein
MTQTLYAHMNKIKIKKNKMSKIGNFEKLITGKVEDVSHKDNIIEINKRLEC